MENHHAPCVGTHPGGLNKIHHTIENVVPEANRGAVDSWGYVQCERDKVDKQLRNVTTGLLTIIWTIQKKGVEERHF